MKKVTSVLALGVVLAVSLAFCACEVQENPEVEQPQDNLAVVTSGEGYFAVTAGTVEGEVFLIDYLRTVNEHATEDSVELTLGGYESEFGYYVTTVNGVSESTTDTGMTYWGLYTNMLSYQGTDYAFPDYGTFLIGNVIYSASGVGISSLPVVAGYTYILALTSYSF